MAAALQLWNGADMVGAQGREYLRLSDAMAEANGTTREDENGAPLNQRRVATRRQSGIRLRRCGGGVQVIRKQGLRNY